MICKHCGNVSRKKSCNTCRFLKMEMKMLFYLWQYRVFLLNSVASGECICSEETLDTLKQEHEMYSKLWSDKANEYEDRSVN